MTSKRGRGPAAPPQAEVSGSSDNEAHLLGDSLLNSLVGGDSNSFDERKFAAPWQQQNAQENNFGIWNATAGQDQAMQNPMQPPIYYAYNQWDSLYTPFGPVKANLNEERCWIPQQVPQQQSFVPAENVVYEPQQIATPPQVPIVENVQPNVGVPTAKIVTYSDVASKGAKAPKIDIATSRNSVQNLNGTSKEQLGPQSSSDSLSESSSSCGTVRMVLTDRNASISSEQGQISFSTTNAKQQDKLTNLYRKNTETQAETDAILENQFTKNATTQAPLNPKQPAKLEQARKSESSLPENLSIDFESDSLTAMENQRQTNMAGKKLATAKSTFPNLNNKFSLIDTLVGADSKSRDKGAYIKNDLTHNYDETNFGFEKHESLLHDDENENLMVPEDPAPAEPTLQQTQQRKKSQIGAKQRQQQNLPQPQPVAAAPKPGGGGKNKKSRNWETNTVEPVAERQRRKKKNETNFITSIYCAIGICMIYLQSVVLWLFDLITDISHQLFDILLHCAKSTYTKSTAALSRLTCDMMEKIRNIWLYLHQKEWTLIFWWRNRHRNDAIGFGLEENIQLPNTGDEAMKRLFMCRGLDAYSILGVRPDCTDDEIKHYYRRQAVLVHPDKNSSYGAEEAFKILAAAFEMIGTSQHRRMYDLENLHRTKAMKELEEMLAKLREKMEEVRSTMVCDCGKKHKRFVTNRELSSARYCRRCQTHHAAQNGDIWAESRCFGFLWYYFACMEGAIFDITEWAGCQKNNLKHIRPNDHFVKYRLTTGAAAASSAKQHHAASAHQPSGGAGRSAATAGGAKHKADGKGFSEQDAEELLSRLLKERLNMDARRSSPPSSSRDNLDNKRDNDNERSRSTPRSDSPPPTASSSTTNAAGAEAMHSKFRPPTCDQGRPRRAAARRRKGSRVM